jgi:hypothetical protein
MIETEGQKIAAEALFEVNKKVRTKYSKELELLYTERNTVMEVLKNIDKSIANVIEKIDAPY